MLMNSVFVAGTLILNLVGAAAPNETDPWPATASGTSNAIELAVTDSFAPPARRRKPARRTGPRRPPAASAQREAAADEEEEAPPPRRTTPAAGRRPAAAEEEDEASSEDEEEDEDRPRPKRRRRVSEEEEEDDEEEDEDAPMASMPSVIPKLFSLEVGVGFIGRNFAYDTPMQKENTFPRLGLTAGIEAFPLLRFAHGWVKRFGIGIAVDAEFGAAALQQPNGASISFPVTQRRWVGDVRYAIVAGERVVFIPAVGVASDVFDLKTTGAGMPPSACSSTSTMPCLADVNSTSLIGGAQLRVALTDEVALSVAGGYIMGLSVSKAVGHIASERTTKMAGYTFEIGGSFMVKQWLAVRAAIPYTHYGYTFTGGTATYTKASETYYGLNLSAIVFIR